MSHMSASEKIKQFIISELITDGSGADLTDSTQLIDSGIVDSLGIMSLIGFLEENFSIQIDGDDLVPENFASIETMSKLVAQKG